MASAEKQFQIQCLEQARANGLRWDAPADLMQASFTNGPLQDTLGQKYNKSLALITDDLYEFLLDTQAEELAKLLPSDIDSDPVKKAAKWLKFCEAVAKQLDQPFKATGIGGVSNVLRQEFVYSDAVAGKLHFKFALFPRTTNPKAESDPSNRNIVRIVHELAYSVLDSTRPRIDLAVFLNGFPLFTIELKNGLEQTYRDGENQYKRDRNPFSSTKFLHKQEPILRSFNSGNAFLHQKVYEPLLGMHRALAHFAVDPHYVSFTSKLQGDLTKFIPFNPDSLDEETSDSTSIQGTMPLEESPLRGTGFIKDFVNPLIILLWVEKFVLQFAKQEEQDGKNVEVEITLLPRYHQFYGTLLAASITLIDSTVNMGLQDERGGLLEWSMGSGKSYGIAWLTNLLNTLYFDYAPLDYRNLPFSLQERVRLFVPFKKLQEYEAEPKQSRRLFTGSGFVVNSSTILDSQLSNDVRRVAALVSRESKLVVHINGRGRYGSSKRKRLIQDLSENVAHIKVLTLQTFPYVVEALETSELSDKLKANLAAKTYFLIRDEVQSFESGVSARSIQRLVNIANAQSHTVLDNIEEQKELDKALAYLAKLDPQSILEQSEELSNASSNNEFVELGKPVDVSDSSTVSERTAELEEQITAIGNRVIAAQTMAGSRLRLVSFGFTGTPKPETLELYGRTNLKTEQKEGLHSYARRQAIDEGYILDCLEHYTSYQLAVRLATTHSAGEQIVDKTQGQRQLRDFINLQSEVLAVKVRLTLKVFMEQASRLIDGNKARAIICCSTRQEAYEFYKALESTIAQMALPLHSLVAFSGELSDPETNQSVTEGSANETGAKDVGELFKTEDYQFLVVANKYQTGYDNEYITLVVFNKRYGSATEANQAGSRGNRVSPALNKSGMILLDLANDPETIYSYFDQYHESNKLTENLDHNALYRLKRSIDAQQFYTADELEEWKRYYSTRRDYEIKNLVKRLKDRYRTLLLQANNKNDKQAILELTAYPALLHRYIATYNLHNAYYSYDDEELELLWHFFQDLDGNLREKAEVNKLSFDGVFLESVQAQQRKMDARFSPRQKTLTLGETSSNFENLEKPGKARLKEIIDEFMARFGVEDSSVVEAMLFTVFSKLNNNTELQQLRISNPPDQLMDDGKAMKAIQEAFMTSGQEAEQIMRQLFNDELAMNSIMRSLLLAWSKQPED